ncbi:MAG TPA: OmpA family protein [Nitrobacter sp.]|nr:OmpA family protein [Nitrobacter sp.]
MLIQQTYWTKILTGACLALLAASSAALAGELSEQRIISGLRVPKTRSLGASPSLSSDDLAFVQKMRGRTRSLSMGDREHMAEIAAKRPKIDLDINFDFNSAELTPKAEPELHNLGKALTSPELAGAVFMLGGHTDGKGGEAYNQTLSERRAATVKRFLEDKYHIPAANLVSAGYGKQGYKNPADPFAPENRRVEVVNMAEKDQASK